MILEYYGKKLSLLSPGIVKLSRDFASLGRKNRLHNSAKKVGIINWWWLKDNEISLDNLKAFVERQEICFFLSEEIFQRYNKIDINDVFALLNKYNVYYILFSEDNNLTVKPNESKSFSCPWFFKSILYVPSGFKPDLVYREKSYAFNLMLGSKKYYRTLSYKVLKDNDNIYKSYLGHPKFKKESMVFLDDEEIQIDLLNQNVDIDKLNTMNHINIENSRHTLSHIVPEKIYTNTHFDIVTETFVKQHHHFLTEKTAKPLATGRFFCWYASQGVISYLEKFGFIFENDITLYDNQINDVDRLDDFLDLVEEISSNQTLIKEIYIQTAGSRKHNMEVYWKARNSFNNDLHSWMLSCLQR